MICFSRPQRNQKVKYYLRKWYRLTSLPLEEMTDYEKIELKILYTGLNVLEDDEIELLSEKYNRKHIVNDKTLAANNNMEQLQYAERRREIEFKMIKPITDMLQSIKKKRSKAIDEHINYL